MSDADRDVWIRGLRATRSYDDRPIPDEALARILEAGRWTGSSLNSQPWTFIVVTEPASRQALARTGRFLAPVGDAAVVVGLVAEVGRGEFDIGRAAQNMMLAADALGIGSCPATLHDQEAVRQLLGVPDDRLARHALALGYPDHDVEATVRANMKTVTGSALKPISEIVRTNHFAQGLDSDSAHVPTCVGSAQSGSGPSAGKTTGFWPTRTITASAAEELALPSR